MAAFIPTVSAHLPVFRSGDTDNPVSAQQIANPGTAQMIFGRLSSGKPDFYEFQIASLFNLHIQLLTPKKKQYDNFRPILAVIGPGLSKTSESLPFSLDENQGAIILNLPPDAPRETFFDIETLSSYWQGPDIRQYLVEPGTYRLAVFDPANQAGAYALRLSDKEDWRPGAIWNRVKGFFKVKFGFY